MNRFININEIDLFLFDLVYYSFGYWFFAFFFFLSFFFILTFVLNWPFLLFLNKNWAGFYLLYIGLGTFLFFLNSKHTYLHHHNWHFFKQQIYLHHNN